MKRKVKGSKRRYRNKPRWMLLSSYLFLVSLIMTVCLSIWNIRLLSQFDLWDNVGLSKIISGGPGEGIFLSVHSTKSQTGRDHVIVMYPDLCQLPLRLSKRNSASRSKKTNDATLIRTSTGIVATVLMGGSNPQLKNGLCHLFPSQLTHFIVPHQLDVLLVVSGNLDPSDIARCLQLRPWADNDKKPQHRRPGVTHDSEHNSSKASETTDWQNLDGSTLSTQLYRATTVIAGSPFYTKVFLAHQPELYIPDYAVPNKTVLEDMIATIEPPMCRAPIEYIQGTRWYTNELLHLKLIQNYDYFIKLDPDIVFTRPLDFSILQDMTKQGAVLGHAAEYPEGLPTPCAEGIAEAVQEFLQHHETCAILPPDLTGLGDRYYTNFFVGRTDILQSPAVLEFARWLSDYPNGFFHHRWTDQIFWHVALQLTMGPNLMGKVADYTNLRCFPRPNCWMSSLDPSQLTEDGCANGGAFLHTKQALKWVHGWNRHLARMPPFYDDDVTSFTSSPYHSSYRHDCRGTRWMGSTPHQENRH